MTNVVITGASAGVGRGIVRAFARRGANIGLIARGEERLKAAAKEVEAGGGRVLVMPLDVADPAAVEAAAERFENVIGPIDLWINAAMVTAMVPAHDMTAEDYARVMNVTFLGTLHGTQAALARMRPRGRGQVLQVGSALSYRAIPLQSAYCAAKAAVVGYTDSLRCELLHEAISLDLTVVHLPAVNTPQFDWSLNRMGRKSQPVPPIFDPDLVGEQIARASDVPRREYWLGFPAVKAIASQRIAPWIGDRMLARVGYEDQTTDAPDDPGRPNNLYRSVPGDWAAHGRFGDRQEKRAPRLWSPAARAGVAGGLAVAGLAAAFGLGAALL
ncbi:SDR family oxidoreductase [Pseudoroseicyclus sp. H15]